MSINYKTIPARELQRHYKQIFETVRGSSDPIIVISNNKPEVALISMELLEKLTATQDVDTAALLVKLVKVLEK